MKIIKIQIYESMENALAKYCQEDTLTTEKIKNNLESLMKVKESLPKDDFTKRALECGSGLEYNCYIELAYNLETSMYYFDAESLNADLYSDDEYSTLEDMAKGIGDILSVKHNVHHGACMKPVFYTLIGDVNTDTGNMFRDLFGSIPTRGLTDNEIEKLENIFKAAVN